MQEIGLEKGNFSEASMEKMLNDPKTPLKGLFIKDHIGQPI